MYYENGLVDIDFCPIWLWLFSLIPDESLYLRMCLLKNLKERQKMMLKWKICWALPSTCPRTWPFMLIYNI